MSEILHIIGLCPDSFGHWNFMGAFLIEGVDVYAIYQNSFIGKFISQFKKN